MSGACEYQGRGERRTEEEGKKGKGVEEEGQRGEEGEGVQEGKEGMRGG